MYHTRPMDRRVLKGALRALGPVILLVVLLRTDLRALWDALSAAEPVRVGAAMLLMLALVELKVLRWRWLLEAAGIQYARGPAWRTFLASAYVGTITPGRVGDALRAQYLRDERGVGHAEGMGSVVMDRLLDLYVLGAFVGVAMVRFGAAMNDTIRIATFAALGGILIAPAILGVPGVAEAVFGRLFRAFLPASGPAAFERFLQSFRQTLRPRVMVATLVLTVLAFGVTYLQAYLLSEAIGLSLPLSDVIGLLAIASLLGLLPISVSGVGVRELFFAAAFPLLGHTPDEGVGFGLLVFGALYLVAALLGFVVFQLRPPGSTAATPEASGPTSP